MAPVIKKFKIAKIGEHFRPNFCNFFSIFIFIIRHGFFCTNNY